MDGETREPIEPGQTWGIPKGGPWGGYAILATILDVRDGWVRYDLAATKDQRLEEVRFRSVYERVPS